MSGPVPQQAPDRVHEHIVDPVRIRDGRDAAPVAPGSSATVRAESLAGYAFPDGPVWATRGGS